VGLERFREPAEEGNMSAVRSSFSNRELEELDQAQREHEPRMEEILDSIRTIIADDKEILSRVNPLKTLPAPQRELAPAAANAAAASEAPHEHRREDEALLSPEAEAAVASAFNALSENIAARRAEAAQNRMREMLRPMLKAWLDENLPKIVAPLVRAEIERVARAR
jgi:cell pole-organizing protein PopZ